MKASYTLPVPRVARPLPPLDPFRHKKAYHRLLSMLFHAEAAALQGFQLLTDPRFVEPHPLFAKAAAKLVEDEEQHLEDIEEILAYLNAGPLAPPSDTEREFWTAWRSGELFALPFKPSVASLFCLFSEGLGYAVLWHLTEATMDPWIKDRLRRNVEDEKTHLRLSITVLTRTLEADPKGFAADLLMYVFGYLLTAKKAIREMRPLLDDVDLDFAVVMGSSFSFVAELLAIVVQRAGAMTPAWRAGLSAMKVFADHPALMEAVYGVTYLPHPPILNRIVYAWGQSYLHRKCVPVTSAEEIEEAAGEAETPIGGYDQSLPLQSTVPPALKSGVVLLADPETDRATAAA